jgi:hypothetical protein
MFKKQKVDRAEGAPMNTMHSTQWRRMLRPVSATILSVLPVGGPIFFAENSQPLCNSGLSRARVCLADGKSHASTQTEFNGWDLDNIVHVVKKVYVTREPTEVQFARYAKSKGWVVQPAERWRHEVRLSVATRLQNRTAANCLQAPGYFIRGLPKAAAQMIWGFYSRPSVTSKGRVLTWTVTQPEMVARMVLDLEGCPRSFLGWGAGRLHSSGRTIAMVIPNLEISHVTTTLGREVLYINFSYVLFQDSGEMHFPKDEDKRQIGISQEDEARLRALALTTLRGMESLGYPLSKKFDSMVNASHVPWLPTPPLPPQPPPSLQRGLSPPEFELPERAEMWLESQEQGTA